MLINKLQISNFMSIKDTTIDFTNLNGTTLIKGENQDVKHNNNITSNGAGKTSILLAVYQCFYNRNPKVSNILSCNNKVTNKAYRIVIDFTINNNEYQVINDRNTLSIKVVDTTNDKVLADRITDSLKVIENIIGMTYTEFKNLTFLTVETVPSLFKTDSNLIINYFKLNELNDYKQYISKERTLLNSKLKEVNHTISIYTNLTAKTLNEDALKKQLKECKDKLQVTNAVDPYITTKQDNSTKLLKLKKMLEVLNKHLQELERENKLSTTSICPTCGSYVEPKSNVDILVQIEATMNDMDEIKQEIEDHKYHCSKLESSYYTKVKKLNTQIVQIESKLVTYGHLESTNKVEVDKAITLKQDIEFKLKILKEVLNVIDRGKVTQAYLQEFLMMFNDVLKEHTEYISYDVELTSCIAKGNIVYQVVQDGIDKDISELSGGELGIIGIIILTSFIKTLHKLVGVQLPFILFDEVFSKFDEVNMERVVHILEKLDNPLFIIQHHDEVDDRVFDKIISAIKVDGITEVIL